MGASSKGGAAAFDKGDRVSHEQYGTGTVTDRNVYHTVIDFDSHGTRRFVTDRVVLERTSVPSPPLSERRDATRRRLREERARKSAS
jgi:hypothetical protein